MTKQFEEAQRISTQIHGLEDKLDMLLADAGQLMAAMTKYRIDSNMDANVGQRALARLSEMQNLMVQARMRACGTHSDLKKIIVTADFPMPCEPTGSDRQGPVLRLAG